MDILILYLLCSFLFFVLCARFARTLLNVVVWFSIYFAFIHLISEKDTISRLLNAYHRADGVTPRPPARMTVRSEVPPVSTPSSFASKNYPRTPNSARSDTKPPAHPLYKKHVQVNRPRGKYPDLRHPSRSPSAQSATPVTSFKYTQREPTSANGIKTPPQLTDFDIDVALHALQHPDTPKSLPLNCYSPGYNLN